MAGIPIDKQEKSQYDTSMKNKEIATTLDTTKA